MSSANRSAHLDSGRESAGSLFKQGSFLVKAKALPGNFHFEAPSQPELTRLIADPNTAYPPFSTFQFNSPGKMTLSSRTTTIRGFKICEKGQAAMNSKISFLEHSAKQQWAFAGTFRKYQKRILDEIENIAADKRVHIVAAPGSGKTILGWEIICRFGGPALILAPSIAIRDQWKDRFIGNFSKTAPPVADKTGANPEIIEQNDIDSLFSTSLRNPSYFTIVTYQSLFSAYSKGLDEETGEDFQDLNLLEAIHKIGLGTICLDEAHHLRSQWHKALVSFIDEITALRPGSLYTVSLTATPPYDSTIKEWEKYEGLCGPIDDEIFVPELVMAGNLCPHQDYVYITEPLAGERAEIQKLRSASWKLIAELADTDLLRRLSDDLEMLAHNDTNLNCALDDEAGFCALVNLMRATGQVIPKEIESLFYKNSGPDNPELGLQFVIKHPELFTIEVIEELKTRLRRHHLLDGKEVINFKTPEVNRILAHSASKLRGVCEIAAAENASLKDRLRLLILTDYIRADYLKTIGSDQPLLHFGVLPIFENLRRNLGGHIKIGVLTGSVVLIPANCLPKVTDIAVSLGEKITSTKDVNASYLQVSFTHGSQGAVRTLTKAFESGVFTVLLGTAALLGEGWDSPCINALITASSVKAFMLSNQMRGRAIRTDPADPDKTANIWHLVTCDTDISQSPLKRMGDAFSRDDTVKVLESHDFRNLRKRFKVFVGPTVGYESIENGLERCYNTTLEAAYQSITKANATMLKRARDRETMRGLWDKALEKNALVNNNYEMKLLAECESAPSAGIKPYLDVIIGAILTVLFQIAYFLMAPSGYRGNYRHYGENLSELLLSMAVIGLGIIFLVFLFLRGRSISQITNSKIRILAQGNAVLRTMQRLRLIESSETKVEIKTSENVFDTDSVDVCLTGGSFNEQLQFAKAMGQLCGPVVNARYLLVPAHRWKLKGIFMAQCVPEIFGLRRDSVDIFVSELKTVGLPMDAIYTRNPSGREFLLKARKLSGSNIAARLTREHRRYEKAGH